MPAAWSVFLTAMAHDFGVVLPARVGLDLPQVVLWTPDLAWLVHAVLGAAVALLALRIAIEAVLLRDSRRAAISSAEHRW